MNKKWYSLASEVEKNVENVDLDLCNNHVSCPRNTNIDYLRWLP